MQQAELNDSLLQAQKINIAEASDSRDPCPAAPKDQNPQATFYPGADVISEARSCTNATSATDATQQAKHADQAQQAFSSSVASTSASTQGSRQPSSVQQATGAESWSAESQAAESPSCDYPPCGQHAEQTCCEAGTVSSSMQVDHVHTVQYDMGQCAVTGDAPLLQESSPCEHHSNAEKLQTPKSQSQRTHTNLKATHTSIDHVEQHGYNLDPELRIIYLSDAETFATDCRTLPLSLLKHHHWTLPVGPLEPLGGVQSVAHIASATYLDTTLNTEHTPCALTNKLTDPDQHCVDCMAPHDVSGVRLVSPHPRWHSPRSELSSESGEEAGGEPSHRGGLHGEDSAQGNALCHHAYFVKLDF